MAQGAAGKKAAAKKAKSKKPAQKRRLAEKAKILKIYYESEIKSTMDDLTRLNMELNPLVPQAEEVRDGLKAIAKRIKKLGDKNPVVKEDLEKLQSEGEVASQKLKEKIDPIKQEFQEEFALYKRCRKRLGMPKKFELGFHPDGKIEIIELSKKGKSGDDGEGTTGADGE